MIPCAIVLAESKATTSAGFLALTPEQLLDLARVWDEWRERPSWERRGQPVWYADPQVKSILNLAPTDRVPQFIRKIKRRDLGESLDERLMLKSGWKEYAAKVADAYDARPVRDPAAVASYAALLHHSERMFKQLQSRIRIKFVDEDEPYANAAEMTRRVKAEGVMYVSTLFSENLVSGWSAEQNWRFRAVHDYIVHIGGNHDFSLRGEMATFNRHAKVAPKAALPALFSEVVGQVAYFITRGKFPSPQKACVLYGFDYERVGYINPEGYRLNFTKDVRVGEARKKPARPAKDKKWLTKCGDKWVSHGDPTKTISPGTKRGDNYCARSSGIPTRGPCSPNALSRKKWRCRGKKSLKASRVSDTEQVLDEAMQDWLFHTTKWSNVDAIARSKKLLPAGRIGSKRSFVSMSTKPLAPSFGDIVLIFRKRSIADRLHEIEYTEEWMRKYPEHAEYVGAEWEGEEAARETAEETIEWGYGGVSGKDLQQMKEALRKAERELKDTKARKAKWEKALRDGRARLKKRQPNEEQQAWLYKADGMIRELDLDIEEVEDEIESLTDDIEQTRINLQDEIESEYQDLVDQAVRSFKHYEGEEEWITKQVGKPMPFRSGELVAVVCKECDPEDIEDLRFKFRRLLPPRYVIDLKTAMERIRKGPALKPLRPGQKDLTPAQLLKMFGRTSANPIALRWRKRKATLKKIKKKSA